MFFSTLKIGKRLGLSFGAIAALTLALGAVAYHSLRDIDSNWNAFSTRTLGKTEAVATAQDALGTGVQDFKNYILRARDYDRRFLAEMDRIEAAMAGYEGQGGLRESERELLAQVRVGVVAYREAMRQAVGMKAAHASIEDIDATIKGADKALKKALLELNRINREDIRSTGASIASTIGQGESVALAGSMVVLALTVLFAWLATRSITRPIARAVETATVVATGDLSRDIAVTSSDETGALLAALRNMNGSLVEIVGQVRSSTDTIRVASSEIAAGNVDLSSRTEEQAASLEETASSLEELTATVRQNADNARQARLLADSASGVAQRGGAAVSDVVATMGAINESSRKIVDIISVIDGIAFQTNILALNAAVEAARAGEQGRGFAVVASEVRTLAQRSAAAAREIKDLIGDAVAKVEAGSGLVDQAGSTMREVVDSIQRVTDIVAEISSASDEQTAGIEQINQAVATMDQATQQNAALVEEAAAASASLEQQAALLTRAVAVFRLGGESQAARPAAALSAKAAWPELAAPATAA